MSSLHLTSHFFTWYQKSTAMLICSDCIIQRVLAVSSKIFKALPPPHIKALVTSPPIEKGGGDICPQIILIFGSVTWPIRGSVNLQGHQLNVAVFSFWQIYIRREFSLVLNPFSDPLDRVTCSMYTTHVYSSVHKTSHFMKGKRKTLPCLSGQPTSSRS